MVMPSVSPYETERQRERGRRLKDGGDRKGIIAIQGIWSRRNCPGR